MTDGHWPSASSARALVPKDLLDAASNLEQAVGRLAVAIRAFGNEHMWLNFTHGVSARQVLDTWRATVGVVEQILPDVELRIAEANDILRDASQHFADPPKAAETW